VGFAVHGYDDLGMPAKPGEPGELCRSHDLVCDQDVPDSRRRHYLGLTQLGAGDSVGPGPEQRVGDGRDLDGLRVGTPADPGLRDDRPSHLGNVSLQLV
jgi:hypothetical protein